MFSFDGVMTKKLIFDCHFEFARHFKTKQNSTQFTTDISSPYIEIDLLKILTKSKMYIFRYLHSCGLVFCKKMSYICLHRGGAGVQTFLNFILNKRTGNFTKEKYI
jgi:hypothetical protein